MSGDIMNAGLMNLRARVATAAGLGVLVVVSLVSCLLYLFYADSVHAQVDGNLVHAAQQASDIALSIKSAAGDKGEGDMSKPVSVGGAELQLLPAVEPGDPSALGPLTDKDAMVALRKEQPYFATITFGAERYRVYTAPLPGSDALVRTSRAENLDTALLRRAALLLTLLTLVATGAAFALGRLAAGRVLRPIAQLTAAAEHVTRTQELGARLRSTRTDEVGRLARTFDAMLDELRDSVEAQRRLVADASHELRTPLTSLVTNLDLLTDGAGLADPLAPQLVTEARTEAHELTSLINDLVDLARYGEVAPHREAVRLDLLVEAAVARMAGRNPGVRFRTSSAPCLVEADPSGLEHAVTNLLDNAVKWSPPGGCVGADVQAGRVEISDQGPGIDPADQSRLFERFYRAASARGLPGSGLGLAIVAQVVRANEGDISVRSGPDGSTFTLALPTAD